MSTIKRVLTWFDRKDVPLSSVMKKEIDDVKQFVPKKGKLQFGIFCFENKFLT